MYNPYGFKFKVSVVASSGDYTGVAEPHITDIVPDSKGKRFMDGSIYETLSYYYNYLHEEKVGDNTYVGTPECPKSLSLDITLEMDEGFSSTVSGLSYNGTFSSRTIERYLDWSRSYSMGPIYFRYFPTGYWYKTTFGKITEEHDDSYYGDGEYGHEVDWASEYGFFKITDVVYGPIGRDFGVPFISPHNVVQYPLEMTINGRKVQDVSTALIGK